MRKTVGALAATVMAGSVMMFGAGTTSAGAATSKASSIDAKPKPIVIGAIAGTTGAYATTGKAVINATQMAVSRINAAGGVLGRKLKLVWGNDGASSTTSALLFKKFLSEGAVAMFGSPDTATVTVSLANKNHIPDLGAIDDGGASIYPSGPSKPPAPWAWSTSLNTYAWGQVVGKYANTNCPGGLAMLHDPTFYGLGGRAGVGQTYKKKLKVTDAISEDWSSGSTQNTIAEINKVKASGADCVNVWLTPQDVAVFVKEVHSLNLKFTVLGNDETCATTVFAGLAGPQATGVYCAELTASFSPNAKVRAFDRAYKKKFGVAATAFALVEYDAVNMLAKVIRQGHSTSATSIRKYMNRMKNYPGLSGKLTFTKQKHVTITAPQLTLVRYSTAKHAWVKASY